MIDSVAGMRRKNVEKEANEAAKPVPVGLLKRSPGLLKWGR